MTRPDFSYPARPKRDKKHAALPARPRRQAFEEAESFSASQAKFSRLSASTRPRRRRRTGCCARRILSLRAVQRAPPGTHIIVYAGGGFAKCRIDAFPEAIGKGRSRASAADAAIDIGEVSGELPEAR